MLQKTRKTISLPANVSRMFRLLRVFGVRYSVFGSDPNTEYRTPNTRRRRNMRLTLAGKLIVFLVFCSILYYAWTRLVPAGTKEKITSLRDRLPGRGTVATPGRSGGSEGGEPARAEQPGDLLS